MKRFEDLSPLGVGLGMSHLSFFQDTLLEVSDPIVLTCHAGNLRAYTHTEGGLVSLLAYFISIFD